MRAVNLIPTEQRKGGAVGRRSQGAAFAVLGLLVGAAILTFMYGMADHQAQSSKAEAAALSARAATVQAQASQLTPYTSFMQMREQRLQTIAQLINSRFDWSSAMGELSRVLPAGVSLSSLEATIASSATASTSSSAAATPSSSSPSSSSSASSSSSTTSTSSSSATPANGTAVAAAAATSSATSATPAGATPTFTLAGCAVSQTVVAQTLVRLRLVSGVSSVSLQSSTKSSSGGGASGGGACPSDAPVFSVTVAFAPLPAPPATSTETLEATADPGSTASAAPKKHVVSSVTKGASR